MTPTGSQSISQRILRESFLFLIASVASRAIGFVMIPVYSRFLTPAEYGTIELIELTTQVVALIIGLGIFGGALLRIYQDYQTEEQRNAVSSTAILGAIAANLIAAAAAISLSRFACNIVFQSETHAMLLRATFVAMAFSNIEAVCLIHARLKGRAVFFVVYSLAALFATLGLNILLIAVQHRGVWGFVLSKLIVVSAGCCFLLVKTLRKTGLRWNRQAARSMIHFGAPLVLANISFFALHFGDRFFLSRYSTMAEVGMYSLAYRFAFVVSFLVGESFSRSWSVAFYEYLKQPDWKDQVRRASLYLSSALVCVGLILCLYADELLHYLVPPSYYGAVQAIPIVVSAYVVREMGDFFRTLLFINKRSLLVGLASFAAAVLNTLLNYLWIPTHGMIGASWATFATWTILALSMFLAARRELQVKFPVFGYAALSGLAILCYVVASAAGNFLPVPLRFVLDTFALGVYALLVWFSGILPREEKEFVIRKTRAAAAAVGGRLRRQKAA